MPRVIATVIVSVMLTGLGCQSSPAPDHRDFAGAIVSAKQTTFAAVWLDDCDISIEPVNTGTASIGIVHTVTGSGGLNPGVDITMETDGGGELFLGSGGVSFDPNSTYVIALTGFQNSSVSARVTKGGTEVAPASTVATTGSFDEDQDMSAVQVLATNSTSAAITVRFKGKTVTIPMTSSGLDRTNFVIQPGNASRPVIDIKYQSNGSDGVTVMIRPKNYGKLRLTHASLGKTFSLAANKTYTLALTGFDGAGAIAATMSSVKDDGFGATNLTATGTFDPSLAIPLVVFQPTSSSTGNLVIDHHGRQVSFSLTR